MGDNTAAGISQREVKTELFSQNVSELTSLRAPTTDSPQKRRGLMVAAGALAFLIGGSAVAGGIYIMNPSLFSDAVSENETTPETDENDTTVAAANVQDNTNSNSEILSTQTTDSPQLREPSKNETQTPDSKSLPPEVTKDNRGVEMDTFTDTDGTVVQFPKDGKSGNIIVTEKNPDGSTTTTTVEQGDLPTSMRKRPPGNMPNSGFDPRNLTPEQRRKLQRMMRNNPQMRPPEMRPPPLPQPTKSPY
jgi:hypothetical protein